ncbi:hypothetical protein HSX10_11685 [Winogradskyella undariae]|uniref:hypothetical protein n=1 Tax=Winogradskyella TaxID=286104 RepID=UPI00156B8BC2|nr:MULTISPECIES: hypothetical protein [Winogradskyella]NRR92229.1 hypothetical protein [Winogradskyella undariae]QXP78253.1 hypothetical protein H0I32_13645 [Winogradskyella sp. HaHa_3_26]
MKLIPKSKDKIALTLATLVALGLFISGLFDLLDYLFIKIILFTSFGFLFIIACLYAFKNKAEKNRLEDTPQDDFN